jgi:hypothetical protein
MDMQERKLIAPFFHSSLLLCSVAAFASIYFILSINNRPTPDDFEFMYNVRKNGWWNGMVFYLNLWNTRWLSILFLNGVYLFYEVIQSFFLYHIFTLICLAVALYRFSKSFFSKIYLEAISEKNVLGISAILLISFFFSSFDAAETFFWINGNTVYLWSVIFILFGFGELLKKEPGSYSILIASFSFFYLGGAFEANAVVVFLLLSSLLIFELRKKSNRRKQTIKLLLFSIFFLTISFSVALSGEGWRNRHDVLGHASLASSFLVTGKAFIKMFIIFLPAKIHWLILFLLVSTGIGARLETEKVPMKYSLLKIFLAFCLLNFLILFPSCYLLRETPPARVWTLNCFLISLFISICGMKLGNVLHRYQKQLLNISALALTILITLFVKIFIEEKRITDVYAAAYDNRMQILIQSKSESAQKEISLEPLPPSGMLYPAEITTDTNDFRNRHLKNYLQLNITPKRKPSQQ